MSQQPPVSDAIVDRITGSFGAQGLMAHLGARLGDIEAGCVHIHLPMSRAVTQQHGYFHGGATSTIADSAGGYAALTLLGTDWEVLTVEFKVNLLAPAAGHSLEAVGSVIKPGRTLTVCNLQVHSHSEDGSSLVASGQQTLIGIRG